MLYKYSAVRGLCESGLCTTIYIVMTEFQLTDYATFAGRVQNVTHFGTFVDIGVGSDGLIPQSRLRSTRPQLGDRIEVKVMSVDISRCRISLDLIRILWCVIVCKHNGLKMFVEKILELHSMRAEEETVRNTLEPC
jgi:predicted RNA-binding protein (virulence factor B family)